jgi:hypothetical protein
MTSGHLAIYTTLTDVTFFKKIRIIWTTVSVR